MAHFAMVGIPAHGHVNPSAEILRTLVARGHRVTYANDESFAAEVRATGAELRPYRSVLGRLGRADEDLIDQLTGFLDDAESMLPQLRDAYDQDRPDLFLYDIAGAPARILAAEWVIPAVQLSPTVVAWDGYEEDTAPMVEQIRADPRGAAYYERYSAWLTENGWPDPDSVAFQGRPDRGLVLIPRVMQPNADRVDPRVFDFVGPVPGPAGRWTRPDAEKVLLVSLGSAFTDHPGFYRRCAEAFGGLPGWHTVLQIGSHVRPADLGPLPPGVETHPWVPQPAVLEQADAFLTHAGMGGSSEGLAAGVPMLVAPQAADQFGNADRLVELGVARPVGVETPVAGLRSELLALTTDPAVRARSAALATEVRAAAGADRAADLIEAELAGAHAARR